MTEVKIEDGNLIADIKGFDKALTLRSEIKVAMTHVLSAEVSTHAGEEIVKETHDKPGELAHSTRIPSKAKRFGKFHDEDGMTFYDVHDTSNVIVIHLKPEDESDFVRLILEVVNPAETVALIQAAKI